MDFYHFAALEPGIVALIDTRGSVWSRGELSGYSNQLAQGLRAAGLQPGNVFAVLAPNCLEYFVAYFAAMQAGLNLLPLNWHLAPAELSYVLQDAAPAALLVHQRLAALAVRSLGDAGAPKVALSVGNIPGFVPLENFVGTHDRARLATGITGRVMLYTSATTGRPKAVSLPLADSASALDRTIAFHLGLGIEPASGVHLCASMLYHAAPLEAAAVALHMGHAVVMVDRWEPRELLRLIEAHRVTTSFMIPSMFVRMVKLPVEMRRECDCSSLKFVIHSGAPCPPDVKREMIDWWGPVIWETYGAAEGAGTIVSSAEWLRCPGTVGRPIPGSVVKIFDENGMEQPAGTPGVVYLSRYTGDRFEYRGDSAKTRAAYRGDLFTVGDVGYVNDLGYLFICDRKIDMIIRGGANIYSAEIERVLILHPNVDDCAVFGVPDELLGESVRAVVQPAHGVATGPAFATELLSFLSARLSAFKIPNRIEFMDSLPRTPTGKLHKRKLRDRYWEAAERRI